MYIIMAERKLRIAVLAPLKRPITPDTTVSRNRVIVDLVTGLNARGHRVTVFGTADSFLPGVEIVPVSEKGLNFLPPPENLFYQHNAYLVKMIRMFKETEKNFD